MTLSKEDMQRLERDAHAIESRSSVTYLADAQRCLHDTREPLDALALLRVLWGSSHAKREKQKAALQDAGRWLEDRIRREIDISPERLELELGWLQRLVAVHSASETDLEDDDRPRPRTDNGGAPFGAHVEQLRAKRNAAAKREARHEDSPAPSPPPPDRLPDFFEARFVSWQEALEAFKTARKRRKQGKLPKNRLLDVVPVAAELQPLAADLACSMFGTAGMEQLIDHDGELPTFQIAVADLVSRDGKRVPSRIMLRLGAGG